MKMKKKLSDEDIQDIRTRLANGEQSKALALEYGVSKALLSLVASGKRRKPKSSSSPVEGNMDKKTTWISDEAFHPLEVEWNVYKHHPRAEDGTFPEVEVQRVTLVHPSSSFLSDEVRRVRLIDLSPETALNLLAWLEEERPTLEKLANL